MADILDRRNTLRDNCLRLKLMPFNYVPFSSQRGTTAAMDTNTKIEGAHVIFYRQIKTSRDKSLRAVLLHKRTQNAPIHPGYWALFGGTLDPGEEPKDAAKREVKEELGLVEPKKRALVLKAARLKELGPPARVSRPNGIGFIQYFCYGLDHDLDKLRLLWNAETEMVEGEGLGWFNAEEIHHLMVRPEDRIALIDFFKNDGT